MNRNVLLIINLVFFAVSVGIFIWALANITDTQEVFKLGATGAIFFATVSFMQIQHYVKK